MVKYLVLIAGALLIYWIVRAGLRRRNRNARQSQAQPQGSAASEDMVRCVACGIHLPRGESLTVRGQFYCCADHQRRHDPGN